MELFYNQYGESGPPLIILHGLLGAHGNWHTLSRTAFREVARVFAVDQRNHGRSPHADRMDYPTLAVDLRDFIDRHHLAPATLLGHSMGGKTAMQTALSAPDRVARLIVVDMTPKAYPPKHTEMLEVLARIDPEDYDSRDEVDEALAEDVPSWRIRQFLLKNLDYDGETYTWKMNLDAIRAHYDDITAALPADATYEGPTLFIRGAESEYIAGEDVEGIRERFPHAELKTIEGAGHWVHADAPEAFAEVVVNFLTETAPSSRA
ncbi:MAG: alpha/beta fold hydrolase [Salinibacter sp.]